MKYNRTLLLTFASVVLLLFSQFNPVVNIVGQTPPQSTTIATGDHFLYSQLGDDYQSDYNFFESTNTTDLVSFNEEQRNMTIYYDGVLDVDFVRERTSLPVDTVAITDSTGYTLPGSQAEGYRNSLQQDFNGSLFWVNETFPVEDLSNRPFDRNGGEDFEFFESNSTYSVIFDEMVNSTLDLDFFKMDNTTTMVPQATLVYRDVYDAPGYVYTINGISQNINVRVVESQFSYVFAENRTEWIPLGPDNDPNTRWELVNITQYSEVGFQSMFIFDSSNGILVEGYQGSWSVFDFAFWSDNLTVYDEFMNPYNFTIAGGWFKESNSNNNFMMFEADSFYGNTRAVSSGSNRIQEGDRLVYGFESSESYSMNSYMNGDSANFTITVNNWVNWGNTFNGTLELDVYRHQPGQFEAVVIGNGWAESWYDETRDSSFQDVISGNITWFSDWFSDSWAGQSMFVDLMNASSNANYDIVAQFDQTMQVPRFFDGQCDGPDCGQPGPGFAIPFAIPRFGPVNHTIFDVSADDDASLIINGYNYTFTQVEVYSQTYLFNQTMNTPISVGDPNNPQELPGMIDIEIVGQQSFYYDVDTGALLAMSEWIDVYVWISAYGTFVNEFNELVTMDLSFSVYGFESFDMLLAEHPVFYQTPQPTSTTTTTPPPSNTTTTTTTSVPSNTTTTTTTSVPTNTTSTPAANTTSNPPPSNSTTDSGSTTESTAPGLPVPIPTVYIIAGLITLNVLIRKKRKL